MELAELPDARKDRVRINKETLEAMLQQFQLAVQQITSGCDDDDGSDNVDLDIPEESMDISAPTTDDTNSAEFYDSLKSRVDCADFLKTLEKVRATPSQIMGEEGCSWDMISKSDTWEGENVELETEDYVLVRQEDIVEGIASFMAAYLLSLEQTKDLTPNELQEALSKTFSTKKKKGKLRKAWDGSKVVYNVASWGATAIGIYQNPALCTAASAAFWTSFRVISKLF